MQRYDLSLDQLTAKQLFAIARVRVDVFVVEQACAYPELDAHDCDPDTRHIWLEEHSQIAAYMRLLKTDTGCQLGRLVTPFNQRNCGHATDIIQYALNNSSGPWILHAQVHLQNWYNSFGFTAIGAPFDDHGIAHQTMRRDP